MTTVVTRRLVGLALLAWTFSGCSLILDTDSLKTGDASTDGGVTDTQTDTPPASPGITVNPTSGLTTTEGGGQAAFTMVLESQPTASVSVAVASSDEAIGTVSPSTLTFTAINWDDPQTVTITGQNNDAATGDQTYQITFDVSSGDAGYDGFLVPALSVTNTDDDVPGITVSPSAITTHEDQAEDAALIEVYINTQPSAEVVVTPTGNAAEGTITPTSLTFAVGEFGPDNKKTFSVKGVADNVVDGDQTYDITFASASGDADYEARDDIPSVSVTNVDNDVPSIVVVPTSGTTTEGGGTQVLSVELGAEPAVEVTVEAVSRTPDEGTVNSPARLTFTTSNWNTAQTVTVAGRADDEDIKDDVTYFVDLTAEAADNPYNGVKAEVTMTSKDLSGYVISTTQPTNSGETPESGTPTVTFDVTLGRQPAGNVDVSATLAGDDPSAGAFVDVTTPHTFTPANWSEAWTIEVRGVSDGVAGGNRDYDVDLAVVAGGGDPYYADVSTNVSLVTVDDGSNSVLASAVNPETIADDGIETATFELSLNTAPSDPVNVTIATNPPGLVAVTPAPIALTADNVATPLVVTVTGEASAITEDRTVNISFTVRSADSSYDGATVAAFDLTLTP